MSLEFGVPPEPYLVRQAFAFVAVLAGLAVVAAGLVVAYVIVGWGV